MTRRSSAAAAFLAVLTGISLALAACSSDTVTRVEREKLFTLQYGRFEDEIDLFGLDSGSTGPDTRIYMQDGLFYIANSGSQKIIQLTSFGDLLSVYYNADTNPAPSFAVPNGGQTESASADGQGSTANATKQQGAESAVDPAKTTAKGDAATTSAESNTGTDGSGTSGKVAAASTRKAISYPFLHPVYLAVNSLKRLYVVDQLPPERQEFDNDDQVALRDVVLRFNPDGSFLDYLGQEGPGGTAFPPITGVYVNSRNETIVTAKSQSGMKVFWYNPDGILLYRIPVSYKGLPTPYDKDDQALATLETIMPDRDSHRLYLKIDYYSEETDKETGSNTGISYDRSCVYPFDVDSGKYQNRIDIPSYEGTEKSSAGTVTFKKPYEFLGITSSGWIFLITPQQGGYALEIADSRSRRSLKRVLSVSDEELAYNALMLSPDGIISALLATQYEASVVWWRTDALIGEIRR
jgi:hypothetical protein